MSGIRGFRAAMPAMLACAVALMFLALVPAAQAAGPSVGAPTVSPPNPLAGDSVTVTEGPFDGCGGGTTPQITLEFELENGGSYTVTNSGPGTETVNGRQYTATLSQPGKVCS
jgi:hypothetical protein